MYCIANCSVNGMNQARNFLRNWLTAIPSSSKAYRMSSLGAAIAFVGVAGLNPMGVEIAFRRKREVSDGG